MNDFTFTNGYVNAAEFLPKDGVADLSDAIQKIIDENPNRTIFFPDGIYTIAKPIYTPADPRKSVSLLLANYAVIKAADGWSSDEAMIQLGGKDFANDIYTNGSNYYFSGGIVDGSNIADGIAIAGGRETAVREVSIKHTRVGIIIKRGANSGSSDSDITNVNIVGNGKQDSVGVLIEGWDNTLTNMRIARVFIGVYVKTAGNFLRNIHPLYTLDYTDYQNSCGFLDDGGNNWYDNCYSDHFGIGFRTRNSIRSTFDSCFCFWYASKKDRHTAFKADGKFRSIVTNLNIGFRDLETENVVLDVGESGGNGILDRIVANPALFTDDTYCEYLHGEIFN